MNPAIPGRCPKRCGLLDSSTHNSGYERADHYCVFPPGHQGVCVFIGPCRRNRPD